jgi:CheY-like chemotaxis protein/HPt (histidine-containing phosphotransfer) domain-containing protein
VERDVNGFSRPRHVYGSHKENDKMHTNTGKPLSRVLVADDDPVIRRWLTSILKSEGYDVVSVSDGRAVFRVLQSDANFTGAVLDLSMPHINGPDLIRYMRTEKRLMRIPVMMITAESQINVLASGLAAGATFMLPKPFTRARLQQTLRMMLGPSPEVEKTTALPTGTRQDQIPKDLPNESPARKAVTATSNGNATVDADQPVNLQVLRGLENGDDDEGADLITELIDLYLENAELEVYAIKTAELKRDASSIKKRVHSLKGSSSTIGAGRIAKLCAALEETCAGSSPERTHELVKKLESEFSSARAVLLAERRGRLQQVMA